MTYGELLEDFGKRMGNGMTLEPDASGTVNLAVDDLAVSLIGLEEVGAVALTGVLGEVPPADHQERLYKALLMANNNLAGANGATFSIDAESNEVKLCRMMPLLGLDGEKFFADVEKFINTLETWHRIVADFRGSEIEEAGAGKKEEVKTEDAGLMGDFGGFMQV